MFQLVVGVISIGIVTSLTLASIFYGGEAFTKGREKAEAQARLKSGGVERVDTTVRSPLGPLGTAGWAITDSY
ncbi:hypothetical protein HFO56_33140 [Rhizobium laguerreae]|uniref:hypothetical protein n=1 Tax=Rhizobium laguerreae TaxID=1076926 RepID=UPI001C908B9E|nr:hypothetical protein [Rhizobium laguerreae]MBY3157171.1 hypothetical protein [Rhizobium laguerreae]